MADCLSKIAFQDFRILLYKDIDILERKQLEQLPLLELVLHSTHASLHKLIGLAHRSQIQRRHDSGEASCASSISYWYMYIILKLVYAFQGRTNGNYDCHFPNARKSWGLCNLFVQPLFLQISA